MIIRCTAPLSPALALGQFGIILIAVYADGGGQLEKVKGAMKGNKEVIDILNEALKHELGAINQYWLHYRMLDNWGYTRLAKKERKESIEEMEHADKLVDRILFLEGMPNLQYVAPLLIGQHIKEVLECDLKAEYIRPRPLRARPRAVPQQGGPGLHAAVRGAAARTRRATSTSSRPSSTCSTRSGCRTTASCRPIRPTRWRATA